MTPKHWIKMFGGMFAIFAIGMIFVNMFRSKREHVSAMAMDFVAEAEAASQGDDLIPVKGYPFRMNGEVVGEMTKLRIDRGGRHHLDGYYYTVRLNDGVDVNRFATCQLVPLEPGKVDATSDWTCLSEGDAGYEDLEDFGRIVFVSKEAHGTSSQTHLLKVPQSFVETVQASGAGSVHMESGSKGFTLTIDGQQIVDIRGNEAGGSVVVKNPATGKNLVEVTGGPDGGTVKVDGVVQVQGKTPRGN